MPTDDPLGRVQPGDPLPTSARWFDRLNDAARRTQRSQIGEGPGTDPIETRTDPANLVLVRAVGAALAPLTISRYGPVPLALTAANSAETRRRPVFDFAPPAADTDPVVVVVEDAPAGGGLARAACAGVAECRVDVASASHRFAVPIPGDSAKLASHATTGYPIVGGQAGTGVKLKYVLMDRLDAGSGSIPPAACPSDFWLTTLGDPSCWTLYSLGGTGRFSGLPREDQTEDDAGVVMVYDGAEEHWVGLGPICTCCGGGIAILSISGDGEVGGRASLTLKLHGSCSDPDAEPFEVVLTEYCSTGDGLIFQGSDPRLCAEDSAPCGNMFSFLVVCDGECPDPPCGCVGCGIFAEPEVWHGVFAGFDPGAFNGDWMFKKPPGADQVACEWIECDDGGGSGSGSGGAGASVFEYLSATEKWRLTHGGSVYEKDREDGDCASIAGVTLTKVSGDGPASVTLTPRAPGSTVEGCCLPGETIYATDSVTGRTWGLIRNNLPDLIWNNTAPECPNAEHFDVSFIQRTEGKCEWGLVLPASCCFYSSITCEVVSTPPAGALLLIFTLTGGGSCPDRTVIVTDVAP